MAWNTLSPDRSAAVAVPTCTGRASDSRLMRWATSAARCCCELNPSRLGQGRTGLSPLLVARPAETMAGAGQGHRRGWGYRPWRRLWPTSGKRTRTSRPLVRRRLLGARTPRERRLTLVLGGAGLHLVSPPVSHETLFTSAARDQGAGPSSHSSHERRHRFSRLCLLSRCPWSVPAQPGRWSHRRSRFSVRSRSLAGRTDLAVLAARRRTPTQSRLQGAGRC